MTVDCTITIYSSNTTGDADKEDDIVSYTLETIGTGSNVVYKYVFKVIKYETNTAGAALVTSVEKLLVTTTTTE